MRQPHRSLGLIALALTCACETPPALRPPTGFPGVDCARAFKPTGSPRSDVRELGEACGARLGLRALTGVTALEQSDAEPPTRLAFDVPRAGACYRVFAVGDRNIEDLDLLLRGAEPEDLLADVANDQWPMLGPTEPICFDAAGRYLLEIAVQRGRGTWALQVWGDQRAAGSR